MSFKHDEIKKKEWFWFKKKANELGLDSFSDKDMEIVEELFMAICKGLNYPGSTAKVYKGSFNEKEILYVKLEHITHEISLRVSFLLNQFGFRILYLEGIGYVMLLNY